MTGCCRCWNIHHVILADEADSIHLANVRGWAEAVAAVRNAGAVMSEVICFRLDSANPREAKALEVLATWQEAGFSRRHVLTEALLRLDDDGDDNSDADTLAALTEVLSQVQDLLENMQNGHYVSASSQPEEPEVEALAESFLASVRQAARPGLRREEVRG